MQETYNRLRTQISATEEMIDKARTPSARERLHTKRKELKAEAHAVLMVIHQEQAAKKLTAEAAASSAQVIEKAAYSASLAGVTADFLPRRVHMWLAHEAQRRKSGAKPRKATRWQFFLVLIGVAR